MVSKNKADKLLPNRSLIRHDADAVARALIKLYELNKGKKRDQ